MFGGIFWNIGIWYVTQVVCLTPKEDTQVLQISLTSIDDKCDGEDGK